MNRGRVYTVRPYGAAVETDFKYNYRRVFEQSHAPFDERQPVVLTLVFNSRGIEQQKFQNLLGH